jgi:hypothetical protein
MNPGNFSRYSDELWAGQPGFDSQQGQEIFLYFTNSRPTLGPTQPPIQWVPRALSPEVKRRGREADHSPPSSTVKNGGAIPPPPIRLHGVVLNYPFDDGDLNSQRI